MRILKDENGQALVLTVLCLTVLLGMMAMGIDVGFMRYQQTQLQTAADAAAIAAGLEIGNCGKAVCGNMKTAASQALIEDGITGSAITPAANQCTVPTSTGLAMIINVGPCILGSSDPNYGSTNMAEVVLTKSVNSFFGSVIGIPTFHLVARAEAGEANYVKTGGGNCIYTKGLEFNSSNGSFVLNNCGIYDGGDLQTNNGDGVTASSFLYYGTWSPNNCNNSCTWNLGDSTTQPTHTTTAQNDPLASLTPPSQPATQDANSCSLSNQDCWGNNLTSDQQSGKTPVNLPPGYYGGINLNSPVVVNLSPGLYYMNGSINVNNGATLECTGCTGGQGVTLYFTNGTLQPNSGSTVQLTAPSTGATSNGNVANMLIWTSSTNSSGMTLDAGSSSYFNGVIYLPDGRLTLNSGSGLTINSQSSATAIDVQDIMVNSGVSLIINGSNGYLGGGGSVLGAFALAE